MSRIQLMCLALSCCTTSRPQLTVSRLVLACRPKSRRCASMGPESPVLEPSSPVRVTRRERYVNGAGRRSFVDRRDDVAKAVLGRIPGFGRCVRDAWIVGHGKLPGFQVPCHTKPLGPILLRKEKDNNPFNSNERRWECEGSSSHEIPVLVK